jgi:hypothetical protein
MLKRFALFFNIMFTLVSLLSVPFALTAFMLFDAPGSENNTYLWVVFWSALALPFVTIGAVSYAWYVTLKDSNYKRALLVLLLPVLDISIIVVGMVLIQVFCHGDFSC